jgi:hypothetical protein
VPLKKIVCVRAFVVVDDDDVLAAAAAVVRNDSFDCHQRST